MSLGDPYRKERGVDLSWTAEAACKGMSQDRWFPDSRASIHPEVLRICGLCPVRRDCYEYADTARPRIEYGVWGGVLFGSRGSRR
jgi:hypothetical protein